jgi:hypothetical protein
MSSKESLDEIQASWDEFDRSADGELFQHYKGGRYEVVATRFKPIEE